MSIASLVASSNLFCIILYISIVVLFAGNKSTTTTTCPIFRERLLTHWPLGNMNELLDM